VELPREQHIHRREQKWVIAEPAGKGVGKFGNPLMQEILVVTPAYLRLSAHQYNRWGRDGSPKATQWVGGGGRECHFFLVRNRPIIVAFEKIGF